MDTDPTITNEAVVASFASRPITKTRSGTARMEPPAAHGPQRKPYKKAEGRRQQFHLVNLPNSR